VTVPDEWDERARYDLDTAKAMLAAGRYLYVLFCCQQAVEKALKGVIALRTGKMPPRSHNLMALAEAAGLKVEEDRAHRLMLLTEHYVQSRYPGQAKNSTAISDRRLAAEAMQFTEELMKWLFGLMKA